MARIIDKLNAAIAAGEPFFSFEYFPPKTEEGVANLKERQMRMAALGPTFCDITWGAGGSTADVTLDVARSMQQEVCEPWLGRVCGPLLAGSRPQAAAKHCTALPPPPPPPQPPPGSQVGVETMMHLTCTNMPEEKLKEALDKAGAAGGCCWRWPPPPPPFAPRSPSCVPHPLLSIHPLPSSPQQRRLQAREFGIRNILALRGDPPKGQDHFEQVEGGFACALDLVKYIRWVAGRVQQRPRAALRIDATVRARRDALAFKACRCPPPAPPQQGARQLLWHWRERVPRGAPRRDSGGARGDAQGLLGRH